jgi:tRNA-specific 2-thiouridylase
MCNKEIKFGLFLKKALKLGADYIATGHYVRIQSKNILSSDRHVRSSGERSLSPADRRLAADRAEQPAESAEKNIFALFEAKDRNKDQSYFLWTLTQEQLKYCLFPIGDYLKSEVRAIAKKAGLPTANKKDSQGICFLGKVSLRDFLREHIPPRRGAVLTVAGKEVGYHDGVHFYTIGQRRIGVGGLFAPYYVAAKDVSTNTLFVAPGRENPALYKKEIELADLNFIDPRRAADCINGGSVLARVRYRQPLAPAKLVISNLPSTKDKIANGRLIFSEPVKFVAPGQSAVFYNVSGEMLGGGVIK